MAYRAVDWRSKGFSQPPTLHVSSGRGVTLYRCWGERTAGVGSSEWGSGYFSLTKPATVMDAELRFNVVGWGNGVHFVSTFLLRPGFGYWLGPVAHGILDVRLPGLQVFVEEPLSVKLQILRSRELLRHDVSVGPTDGNA